MHSFLLGLILGGFLIASLAAFVRVSSHTYRAMQNQEPVDEKGAAARLLASYAAAVITLGCVEALSKEALSLSIFGLSLLHAFFQLLIFLILSGVFLYRVHRYCRNS